MQSISLESLDNDTAFKLRLEIALRYQAIKIMQVSKDKEKFKTYIKERENIIQKLVGEDSEVREKGKVIYP
ncbi:MAG: hypothetical protein M1306_04315 [Candidatus Thermoplasmatota archaeon]|jgi:hypothetical protein|nr:hypothetical protein [Candidatus Thermoplasmatota archaeon]